MHNYAKQQFHSKLKEHQTFNYANRLSYHMDPNCTCALQNIFLCKFSHQTWGQVCCIAYNGVFCPHCILLSRVTMDPKSSIFHRQNHVACLNGIKSNHARPTVVANYKQTYNIIYSFILHDLTSYTKR